MSEAAKTGTGPDDRGLSAADILRAAKPVERERSPFAPPVAPRSARDLPDVGCPGAKFTRGDDVELADILHKHFLGKYTVSIAGDVWQYDPDRNGWWRRSEETMLTWVSRLAGGFVYHGETKEGEAKMSPLSVSASKARGAVKLATARCHHAEDDGDFWTGGPFRKNRQGIVQFKNRAVIVTQSAPGELVLHDEAAHPRHRVRAARVMPCMWSGLPDMADLSRSCPALWQIHTEWWGRHGAEEAYARLMSVLEVLGASVLGFAPKMARALFLFGPGGTGKSTVIDLMTRWCQPSAVASVTPQDFAANRFAAARLDGALLNVVDDLPKRPILDAGVWKSAITGGRLDVERKGQDGYGIYPTAGHIYAGNKLPVAVSATSGFWRRWLIVGYDRVFHKTDADRPIINELLAEMDHIMAFAIAAFMATGGVGGRGYTEPGCHADVMADWDRVSDSVSAFVEEHMTVVGGSKVSWPKRSEVYRMYRSWALDVGRKPVSAHEWSNRVRDFGYEVAMSRGAWRVGCEVRAVDG